MGMCSYCGRSAGLFRSKHAECETKHKQGWTDMARLATQAVSGQVSLDTVELKLTEIARRSYIPTNQCRQALITGWENAVDHFLDDGHLSVDEEKQLSTFQEYLSLLTEALDQHGAYSKLVKAVVLRALMEGTIPQRISVSGTLPFNFQKSEQLIWVFPNTAYYEAKTRRQYVGRSQGVSIRIVKGVYYRVGALRGSPVETTERVHMDTGLFARDHQACLLCRPQQEPTDTPRQNCFLHSVLRWHRSTTRCYYSKTTDFRHR